MTNSKHLGAIIGLALVAAAVAVMVGLLPDPPKEPMGPPPPPPIEVTLGMPVSTLTARLGPVPGPRRYRPDAGTPVIKWDVSPSSFVYVEGDKVVGFGDFGLAPSPITIKKQAPAPDAPPLGRVGGRDDVVRSLGLPDRVAPVAEGRTMWDYGNNLVTFAADGRLEGWSNTDGALRVDIGQRVPDAPAARPGATHAEVIAALGTPASLHRYAAREVWSYEIMGERWVRFDGDGKLLSFSNQGQTLNLTVGHGRAKKGAPPFGPGASPADVVAVQGEPEKFDGAGASDADSIWTYPKRAWVTFVDGKVHAWNDPHGVLHTRR